MNLNNFKMGHVILYQGSGRVGNLISSHQKKMGFSIDASLFTHVEVLGGGPYSVRVNPPASKVVDIRKEHAGRKYVILSYNGDLFSTKRYKIAFWSASLSNLKYDYKGILKFKAKSLIWHDKSRYFCSENVCWSMQKEYRDFLGGMEPHECMPAHFYKAYEDGLFDIVAIGDIPAKRKEVKSKWRILPIKKTPSGTKLKGGFKIFKDW